MLIVSPAKSPRKSSPCKIPMVEKTETINLNCESYQVTGDRTVDERSNENSENDMPYIEIPINDLFADDPTIANKYLSSQKDMEKMDYCLANDQLNISAVTLTEYYDTFFYANFP